VEDNVEKMLLPASTLLAAQEISAKEVREKSKNAYSKLLDANLLTTGVIASALLRVNGEIAPLQNNSLERGALIACFVTGVGFCEKAISEGYYLQALALLRQELETIAAMEEVKQGVRQNGKTPNVGHLPCSLPRLYGDLSAAAHAAKHQVLRSVAEHKEGLPGGPDGTVVWRMIPGFDNELSRRLYSLHVMLMIQLAVHLNDYHEELHRFGLTDQEVTCLNMAIDLLLEEKCLELPE
jgi:hypothetical protein